MRRIVRNFHMVKGWPLRPTRTWRNKTGPLLVQRTASAAITNTGDRMTSAKAASTGSNTAL